MSKIKDFIARMFSGPGESRGLSLENPATPLSAPADWLFETLSGGFGLDGQIYVNEQTAMQLTTVRACVKAISEDIGTVPLHLYSTDAKGNRRMADNRPEYNLLHRKPNPHMTACSFRQAMSANCLLWGNAYAEIEYNGAGKVTALWPLLPQFVRMEMMPSGTLRYISTNPYTAETKVILSDDIIHLKDMSMDGYSGLYTIRHHRTAVGLGLALENFGLYYFLNGSRPGGVLEMVGKMTPEAQERIRSSWQHMFAGPRNTNRIAILEEGMKFNPTAINNDNAQYIESRKLQADEIARLFRVPPHVIGILEKATFSNIEHQSLDYVKSCLRPWFVRWEEELNAKLFPQWNYTFEHDEDGLLRGDFATRMTGYAAGRQWGWLSVNDIRRHENMNPVGPEGDIYLTPLNMTDAAKADEIALPGQKPAPSGDPAGKLSAEGDQVAVSPAERWLGGFQWPREESVEQPQPIPAISEVRVEAEDAPAPVKQKRFFEPEDVRSYALPIFEDAVRRSLNYDRNSQLRKSVSRAFTKVLGLMARMMGRSADADLAARRYADDLYLRRDEWDGMTTPQIVEREFDLACAALKPEALESEL